MPTVKPIGELTLAFSVKDRATTAAWYKTHFGFEELYSVEEIGWTELSTHMPGVTIGLGEAETPQPGNLVPVFGVEDLDSARSALEAEGIAFDGDSQTVDGMVKLATFFDPDTNAIMLSENLMDET